MTTPLPFQAPDHIFQIGLSVALGMFMGLEREWSQKSAGIRTFALISLSATIFLLTEQTVLLAIGAVLVVAQGLLLGVRSLLEENHDGLFLTTSATMAVAYGVGVFVGKGLYLESVTVTVLSALLLILKRELHGFAQELSQEEVMSVTELSILAFVIYPLLPQEAVGPWNAIAPRTVWLLVVAIGAIGCINYVLMQRYAGRGLAVTGFFGSLVNSTAVIVELATRAQSDTNLQNLVVGSILLANAAMAIRNAIIVILFIPAAAPSVGLPLGVIALSALVLAMVISDWQTSIEPQFDSPFSMRKALTFGGMFLGILLLSAGAQELFGAKGFLVTAFLAGLVSSGTATTTAVTLFSTGTITAPVAVLGVVVGTIASICVKVGIAASIERSLVLPVAKASTAIVLAGLSTAAVVLELGVVPS